LTRLYTRCGLFFRWPFHSINPLPFNEGRNITALIPDAVGSLRYIVGWQAPAINQANPDFGFVLCDWIGGFRRWLFLLLLGANLARRRREPTREDKGH
jgi:hypothetical protein